MKCLVKWFTVLLFPLLIGAQALAEDYTEGKEYLKLAVPQPTAGKDRIEVVELFWYGCPHCYRLEPHLDKWLADKPEDVAFVRMPAILGPGWELLAKAYFIAELLNVSDRTHGALFRAIHEQKQRISDERKLREFFVSQGVSGEDFDKTIKSFAVAVKLNNARLMTRRYAITGVPALIVNGKYSTGPSKAGGNTHVIKVVNYLIGQERGLAGKPDEPATTAASQ